MSDILEKDEEEKIIPEFTAAQIVQILDRHHDPKECCFFDELRIGTSQGKDSEQRLDGWSVHYFKSKRNVTRSYEIKVSRSDFKSEISKPLKRRPALRLANEMYFVAPQYLLEAREIPPECGLLEVTTEGDIKTTLPAPFRDVMPPTWLFVAAITRRIDRERMARHGAEMAAETTLRLASLATQTALVRHLRRWREHNIGSREVPDKILAALEDLKRDVDEIIKSNIGRIDYL
jgi:hypothetical protein